MGVEMKIGLRAGAVVCAAACLASCMSSRLLSYGTELSDAVVRLGPAAFSVYVHPEDDTLLIQRGIGQASAVDGVALIRIVGEQFLEPVDCDLGPIAPIASGSWEAKFACPAGTDLRALAANQRAALRAGQPITP